MPQVRPDGRLCIRHVLYIGRNPARTSGFSDQIDALERRQAGAGYRLRQRQLDAGAVHSNALRWVDAHRRRVDHRSRDVPQGVGVVDQQEQADGITLQEAMERD
jgi:hypothetical protein